MKRTRTILGTALLTTAVAVLAAPAYAAEGENGGEKSHSQAAAQSTQAPANANGNGAENANSNSSQAASSSNSSGNSATAPGQVKKADQAQSSGATSSAANASEQGKANSSGGAKSKQASSSAGVKPSNSTSHNTSAAANSNATKLYGNGQTAGQIAIQHGASANAVLYGPGNSQPHKTAPCGEVVHGKGGGFDVHALKAHAKKHVCGDEPSVTTGPKDPAVTKSSPSHVSRPAVTPSSPETSNVNPPTSSGVEGAAASNDGGVLAAVGAIDEASLPFTGLSLWSVGLVALVLVGVGLSLRRQAVAEA